MDEYNTYNTARTVRESAIQKQLDECDSYEDMIAILLSIIVVLELEVESLKDQTKRSTRVYK